MNAQEKFALVLLLGLSSCASVRAPPITGSTWSGQELPRISAQIRIASDSLAEGWLIEVSRADAEGSYFYHKRSGAYEYSGRGYFRLDAPWISGQEYIGVLQPQGIFCVLNPELQGDVLGNTVTTFHIYDYCTQLVRE